MHPKLSEKLKVYKESINIIPCGVNDDLFFPIPKSEAKIKLGWKAETRYVLFSSAFDNKIKNVSLANSALSQIDNYQLVELKGYKEQINLLLNASDLLLVTSFSETGPIIVKEALACNCPIVSTNVGDVKKLTSKIRNCYVTSYKANDVMRKINLVLMRSKRTNGRRLSKISH